MYLGNTFIMFHIVGSNIQGVFVVKMQRYNMLSGNFFLKKQVKFLNISEGYYQFIYGKKCLDVSKEREDIVLFSKERK